MCLLKKGKKLPPISNHIQTYYEQTKDLSEKGKNHKMFGRQYMGKYLYKLEVGRKFLNNKC